MITERQARKLTGLMRQNLMDFEENIKLFFEGRGFEAMGYETLTQWWDVELKGIPLATKLRNTIILMMLGEQTGPSGQVKRGGVLAVADAMGVSSALIQGVRHRNKPRITGRSDDDMVMLGVMVPNRWRKHIIKFAMDKNVNMADIVRPILKRGMKERGVDLEESIRGLRARSGS